MPFDPYSLEVENFPPLYSAFLGRDFRVAQRLIDEGAQLDDLIESDGDTFLHRASQGGDLEMVSFYLKNGCPITLEQFDYISQTPLIRASANGQVEVVRRLLKAKVDPNRHEADRAGNTAIREAVRGGYVEIVSLLLRAGADPTIRGWMNLSAVDQAWDEVKADRDTMRAIQSMLKKYKNE